MVMNRSTHNEEGGGNRGGCGIGEGMVALLPVFIFFSSLLTRGNIAGTHNNVVVTILSHFIPFYLLFFFLFISHPPPPTIDTTRGGGKYSGK
jgi:hypothetical protein